MKLSSHLQVISLESNEQISVPIPIDIHSQSTILANLPSHSSSTSSTMLHNIMEMGTVHQSDPFVSKQVEENQSSPFNRNPTIDEKMIIDTEIVSIETCIYIYRDMNIFL